MSAVLAVLNCYCPQTGRNMGQMAFRADGTHEFTGEQPERAMATMLRLKRMIFPRGRQSQAVAEHTSLLPMPKRVEMPRRRLHRPELVESPTVRDLTPTAPRLVDGGLGIEHVRAA